MPLRNHRIRVLMLTPQRPDRRQRTITAGTQRMRHQTPRRGLHKLLDLRCHLVKLTTGEASGVVLC